MNIDFLIKQHKLLEETLKLNKEEIFKHLTLWQSKASYGFVNDAICNTVKSIPS